MGRLPRRISAHISPTSPQSHESGGTSDDNQEMGRAPSQSPAHSPSTSPRTSSPGGISDNQDMGRLPRWTSAHSSPSSPQAPSPGDLPDNQNMGLSPRRTSAYISTSQSHESGDTSDDDPDNQVMGRALSLSSAHSLSRSPQNQNLGSVPDDQVMGRAPSQSPAHSFSKSPQNQNLENIFDDHIMSQAPRRGPVCSPSSPSQDPDVIPENRISTICETRGVGLFRSDPPRFLPSVIEDVVPLACAAPVSVRKSSHFPVDYTYPHEEYDPDEPSLTRCTPQLFNTPDSLHDHKEKPRVRLKLRSRLAHQSSHGKRHYSEYRHTAKMTTPPLQSRPTYSTRSRPRSDEDFHGNPPLISEESLPSVRRRRVQEEPPVCPVDNDIRTQPSASKRLTTKQINALVNRAIQNNKYREAHQLCDRTSHPFSAALRSVILPRSVFISPIEPYQGQGDPYLHICKHEVSLFGQGVLEDHLALLFPSTLAGPVLPWFFSFPPESVTSWPDLRQKFLKRYSGETLVLKNPSALDNVQQGIDETLAQYQARFNLNLSKMEAYFMESEIIHAFQRNLRGRLGTPLQEYMIRRPVQTLEELASKIKEYIDLERTRFYRSAIRSLKQTFVKPREGLRTGSTSSLAQTVYDVRNIKLTRELSFILIEMRELGLDTPPSVKKEGVLLGGSIKRWCDYHKSHGHHTDNCHRLRADIMKQIRKGKLLQFISSTEQPNAEIYNHPTPMEKGKEKVEFDPPPVPPSTWPPPGPVMYIEDFSGKRPLGGIINRQDVCATQVGEPAVAKERPVIRPQRTISFSDADLEHVAYPHDDALVVTLQIGGYYMQRILIDGGSSADILFKEAFLALGFSLHGLRPADIPLIGFSGTVTNSLGSVTLPVILGSGATRLRTLVTFLVVDAPAIHNAIIGRTTINWLQIIPSTVHQKMKYWTPYGVGEVLGDQAASRSCYDNALRPRNQSIPTSSLVISPEPTSRCIL